LAEPADEDALCRQSTVVAQMKSEGRAPPPSGHREGYAIAALRHFRRTYIYQADSLSLKEQSTDRILS
jgi:hypothetical protein